ncbi:MAG: hypothetical protein QM645_13770 [Asticcacaulis sp.]
MADTDQVAISAEWLKSASISQVAARLLPRDVAADVVGIRVGYGSDHRYVPRYIVLYNRAERVTPQACRQSYYRVPLRPFEGGMASQIDSEKLLSVGPVRSSVQVGLRQEGACEDLPVERFASLDGKVSEAKAIETLEWVASLQSREALPQEVVVTCQNSSGLNAICPNEPFAAFRSLPLENTHIIGADWLVIMPDETGQYYWDVRIETDGEKRRISLEWGRPAPF